MAFLVRSLLALSTFSMFCFLGLSNTACTREQGTCSSVSADKQR